jgi:hypothetical protein
MKIKLSNLNPQFIQLDRTSADLNRWSYREVKTLAEADGVRFLCPVHFEKNNGAAGTHSVICWFRDHGIPAELSPGPGRWVASGELKSLTLIPSVDLGSGDWHGHIINGEVT